MNPLKYAVLLALCYQLAQLERQGKQEEVEKLMSKIRSMINEDRA